MSAASVPSAATAPSASSTARASRPQVLAHRIDGTDGSASTVLFLHNLSDVRQVVDLSKTSGSDAAGDPQELFADGRGKALTAPLRRIDLPPYGYRWIRLLR